MSKWLELARRCEQATGADRGIDEALCLATGGPRIVTFWLSNTLRPLKKDQWYSSGNGYVSHPQWVYPHGEPGKAQVDRYTASLDAITALIERELPGHYWDAAKGMRLKDCGPYWATVYCDQDDYFTKTNEHPGATAALALCAAFCRAMAERGRA